MQLLEGTGLYSVASLTPKTVALTLTLTLISTQTRAL